MSLNNKLISSIQMVALSSIGIFFLILIIDLTLSTDGIVKYSTVGSFIVSFTAIGLSYKRLVDEKKQKEEEVENRVELLKQDVSSLSQRYTEILNSIEQKADKGIALTVSVMDLQKAQRKKYNPQLSEPIDNFIKHLKKYTAEVSFKFEPRYEDRVEQLIREAVVLRVKTPLAKVALELVSFSNELKQSFSENSSALSHHENIKFLIDAGGDPDTDIYYGTFTHLKALVTEHKANLSDIYKSISQ